MNPPDEQKLEQLVHRTLRSLPPRRAPLTLEQRVLAELERRAALPWWRQSFTHWPLAARGAFILVSAGVVKLVLMAIVWAQVGFDAAAFAPQFAALQTATNLAGAVADACTAVLRSIPPLWLYGAAAVLAALYTTLFGLGAAAYRTLYANR
jgi:hypothetical protein